MTEVSVEQKTPHDFVLNEKQAAKVETPFEKTMNRYPSAVLVAELVNDMESMPLLWRFAGTIHLLAIVSIVAYFNDGAPIDLAQVQKDAKLLEKANSHEVNSSASGDQKNVDTSVPQTFEVPRGKTAFKKFFHACRRVNPLYCILPMSFVSILICLDLASNVLKKSPHLHSLWKHAYATMARNFADPRWIRDFSLDIRPLILTWLCLVPPIGIFLSLCNACNTIFKSITQKKETGQIGLVRTDDCLVIRQQVDEKRHAPQEFYNSIWFNPVVALPYLLAVPTSITLTIYFRLGIDTLLGNPSSSPHFHTVFVIIGLYIYGLAWCLSTLFFRSYFTFCWNFTSPEYDLEVYPDRIKKLPVKGWFLDFMRLATREPASQILWTDVCSVKYNSGRLPATEIKPEVPLFVVLRKVALLFESLATKMEIHNDFLEIKSSLGGVINVRLWELTSAEKLKLFESIRLNCPSLHLDEAVQEALVGSSVLREPQYTQIWFDVLTATRESHREGHLNVGQSLKNDTYKIKSTLASGGQAVIYLAEDPCGTDVVLKEFQLTPGESFGAKIESAKNFENESAILGQLSHERIVKMLDMFYENGRIYIVLEHVEGKTLRQIIEASGRLRGSEIQNLCKQMCSILSYLHQQEPAVVHRDFTPDNIILQPTGELKLIDFSVAERKKKKESIECAGKHSYTPPEQFAGDACVQSDIYALGATLYFLATGSDPVPISVSRIPGEEEQQLSQIIARCTQLDLAERYTDVKWILNELDAD